MKTPTWNDGYKISKHPSPNDIVSNYALAQGPTGLTLVNSPSELNLRVANTTYIRSQSSVATFSTPVVCSYDLSCADLTANSMYGGLRPKSNKSWTLPSRTRTRFGLRGGFGTIVQCYCRREEWLLPSHRIQTVFMILLSTHRTPEQFCNQSYPRE